MDINRLGLNYSICNLTNVHILTKIQVWRQCILTNVYILTKIQVRRQIRVSMISYFKHQNRLSECTKAFPGMHNVHKHSSVDRSVDRNKENGRPARSTDWHARLSVGFGRPTGRPPGQLTGDCFSC